MTPATRCAIEELNTRYAWSLDRQNYAELYEVFTADARYTRGGQELRGAKAIVASFASREGTRTTRHVWGALDLAPHGPGVVASRSCWFSFAGNAAPPVAGTGVYMVADFFDVYVRDGSSRWWISERLIEPVFRDVSLAPV